MKKTTKNIIIALAVLLVLGAAAAVLLLTTPVEEPEEETSSTSSTTMEKLIDQSITDIKDVVIDNSESGESLTLVPAKSGEDSEENNTFTIKGWEDEDVITANVLSLAQSFYSVTPTKEIGQVENLAEYGLSGDGLYKVTVSYTNGSSDTILVGSEAGETYGRYALYDDTVYIIPGSIYLTKSKYEFINTSVLSIPDIVTEDEEGNETTATSEFKSLRLSGTNYPQEILMKESEDELLVYEIAEPVYAGANSTWVDSLLEQLQTITASGVAAVQATDEDLEKHGLDEPSAVVEYVMNGEKHTLRLGDKSNGIYSLMADDNTTIYLIGESSVDSWANKTVYQVRDSFIRLVNIKSVEKLTVTAADGVDVYDVERILNEERSTESSPFYDLEISKDGEAIEYDNYQPFYQMLLSVSLLNEEVREPEGDPVLTIRYDRFDGGSEEICFYKDSAAERRYIVTLNGQPSGVVRSTDVEKILEAKPIVAANQSIEGEDE